VRKIFALFLIVLLAIASQQLQAQFYNGSSQEFGKNRIQYQEFFWSSLPFDRYKIHYHKGGRNLAVYTAKATERIIFELEAKFDYGLDDQIDIIVFNKLDQLRQSNMGYQRNDPNNIGGVTRIVGSKIFVYFEGDHAKLDNQIRGGIAEIMINQMMYGTSWKDMVKNSTLLNLPNWYVEGLRSYVSEPWNVNIDNRVRDGVLSGRFEKFNRLQGDDAQYAGHALWKYIANTYGESVIPNILYMARISRNIESGFLFVLGISLNSLTEESLNHYARKYEADDEIRDAPSSQPLDLKTKKFLHYSQLKIHPEGDFAAFTTNEMGQYKVWLYDIKSGKKKKLIKEGHKIDRVNDLSYPLLAWHPKGELLAIILEEKNTVMLYFYNTKTGKLGGKQIYNMEKVLSIDYASNGKKMVFSGVKEGQSDVFIYSVAGNSYTNITNDLYDDLYPRFLQNSTKVIFSSNRLDDTLRMKPEVHHMPTTKDLFLYDYASGSKILKRVTETPQFNETYPAPFSDGKFSYLSDENGINNRYLARFDSVISHIDTTIHYRYFTTSTPISNYSRNILEQDVNPASGYLSEIIFQDGKHHLYLGEISKMGSSADMDMQKTGFRESSESSPADPSKEPAVKTVLPPPDVNKVTFVKVKVFEQEKKEEPKEGDVDFENYTFESEGETPEGETQPETTTEETSEKSRFLTLSKESAENPMNTTEVQEEIVPREFKLPNTKDYSLNFTATNIVTQFDFDFANQTYQRFNGEPYFNQGLATVFKVDMMDLFEDYNVQGGLRYSLSNNFTEYFLAFENRVKRMDKTYLFQRSVITRVNGEGLSLIKNYTHQGRYILKWPFSEVASLRGTFLVRNDRFVNLSTDLNNLEIPNENQTWTSAKLEYVYDNTISRGLNLYNGTRAKLFGEFYNEVDVTQLPIYVDGSDIFIFGVDARNYKRIHRDLIWANRVSASTSFGSRKLIYYMGGVDNWVVFSDNIRFDTDNPIPTDQNYYFQSVATPMRGFLQNARNGNSFALINSEIRWPVFKYLMNKPIKSDFISNFQMIAFGDVGTAWTGRSPLSDDNAFNTTRITRGSITVVLRNQKEPLIGAYGFGIRSKLWGYFARLDYAWPVEDRVIGRPRMFFSLGLDF